ncbi:hypothetical protein QK292_17855 [Arthrobacter sp. AL08]|nr:MULTISPECIES: hypothetical protein [Micrococcaceae]MCB5281453.1 hypothetical protein [Arthrobacter sp. ES1]MDI3243408.1 hypothetical protein [Arthrobacter sp. AL05]MDI3279417.1 hypothetical protein [Arthrobacter sp. AL08]MDJ0354332.1 hypothetical protein [Pseudarthrobacter sp. PH31-O2]WGZ80746.1 hypothetical protein QI450_06035 [Arthrobacter sp. EM1]
MKPNDEVLVVYLYVSCGESPGGPVPFSGTHMRENSKVSDRV